MNLLFIRSSKALPFLLFLAYWPIGCLLFIQSWAWPRNWDDMHRAFNGIDPYHNFVGYGIDQSRQMLKLLIHDPILTLSNRFDYQNPAVSGLLETFFLLFFMVLCTVIALKNGSRLQAFVLVIGFNLLTGTQSSTFLPPAAYPLGFSFFFIISVVGSVYFNAPLERESNGFTPRSKFHTGIFYPCFLVVGEQLAYLFYSCNYVQSFLFWLFHLVKLCLKKYKGHGHVGLGVQLLAGIRFIPFALASIIWRLEHSTNSAESFGEQLATGKVILGSLRWSVAGTSAGGLAEMSPQYKYPWELPLEVLLISSLLGLLTFAIGTKLLKSHQINTALENIRLLPTSLLYLGASIMIGWSLPVLSSRYYNELLNSPTQSYAGSRYAGLGLILVLSYITYEAIKRVAHPKSSIFIITFLLSITFCSQNVSAAINQITDPSLRLNAVCINSSRWDRDLYLPSEVFQSGVETGNWITGFPDSSNNDTLSNKRSLGIKLFTRNSLKLCNNSN